MVYVSDTITREYSFLNFNKHFVFRKGHCNPEVGQPSPQNTNMWIRTWIIFWFVNSERPENFSSQYLNYRPKITGEDSFSHCWNNWHDSSAYSNMSPSTDGGSIDVVIVKNTIVQVVLMRFFFSCGICQNLKICLFDNWGMSDVKYFYKRQAWLLKFCQTTNNAWKL